MGDRIRSFLSSIERLSPDTEISRRREELIERAATAGYSREYADLIYDVATEEDLDPVIAFEVVRAGVGVRELADPLPDEGEETQVEAAPLWVESPPSEDDAVRERRMRLTFRRLRSAMTAAPSRMDALKAFVEQPDVGAVEY